MKLCQAYSIGIKSGCGLLIELEENVIVVFSEICHNSSKMYVCDEALGYNVVLRKITHFLFLE